MLEEKQSILNFHFNVTTDLDIKFAGRQIAGRETLGATSCLPD
jgi:hypothetical protein